jgi:hypothetical protein
MFEMFRLEQLQLKAVELRQHIREVSSDVNFPVFTTDELETIVRLIMSC